MPVTWRKSTSEYSIIVWKSSEPLDMLLKNASLNVDETAEWNSFSSETRKREWLTVRNILKILVPGSIKSTIYYDGNDKPHLLDKNHISISHSHEFVAVMIAYIHGIGVDIEFIHPRISKLAQKFLSENEKQLADDNNLEKLHVVWGAKEVLYKIHSIGGIDFRKDFLVHPFEYIERSELTASLIKKGFEEDFNIMYEKTDQYMLTWAHRSINK